MIRARGTVKNALLPIVFVAALAPAASRGGEPAGGGQTVIDPATADIDAILDRLDDLYRSDSSIARVELTVVKPRRTRTLRQPGGAWPILGRRV